MRTARKISISGLIYTSGGPSKDVREYLQEREGPEVGERDALNLNTQSNKKG